MKKIRFLMIGGFLGAGKTTTIARMAQHYIDAGKNVGLVTNDQAYNLVDTENLRSQGFRVGEVPGACFCCKFDDLVTTANQLSEQETPDIIIAEPVGSCTDLYATVVRPLQELFGDRFEMGPLIVLLKPEHGRKILGNQSGAGFSPKAEYIFLKQIEEADFIVVNKTDKLSDEQKNDLCELAKNRFDQPVLAISSKTGDGFNQLLEVAETECAIRREAMEVDYDIYAEGEAELGWFNCQLKATSDSPFELDAVVLGIVQAVGEGLNHVSAETAHLKVLGQTISETAIANQVDSDSAAELSLASEIKTTNADLLINARVATDPDSLTEIVQQQCGLISEKMGINFELTGIQSFRPGRPEPTHRMS
jgi:Ni2+-binding GTPase involved in maturation of urease and hydrogenase